MTALYFLSLLLLFVILIGVVKGVAGSLTGYLLRSIRRRYYAHKLSNVVAVEDRERRHLQAVATTGGRR